jgi:hypothetical protein
MACRPEQKDHIFDAMSKALSSALTRRDAFKWVSVGVLSTMLSAIGLRGAEAAPCTFAPGCLPNLCGGPPGGQCFCSRRVKNGVEGTKAKCIDNMFCSGLVPCQNKSDCPTGFKCGTTGCCGIHACVTKCGKSPCCSPQGLKTGT